MNARAWLFAAAMSASTLALAQAGVTETTDQAKIAEIERHAQELQSGAPSSGAAMEDHDGMKQHGMKEHGKRHHKAKAMRKHAPKAKPADTPMANDSKG